jgi:hypothetical protein
MDSDEESSTNVSVLYHPTEVITHPYGSLESDYSDEETISNYSDHTLLEINEAMDISKMNGNSYIKSLSEKQLLELLNLKITPVEFSKFGVIFFKLRTTNQCISKRNISSICWIKNKSCYEVKLKVEDFINKTYSIINFPTGCTYGILQEYENESFVNNSVEINGKKIVLVPGTVYNYCSLICQKVNL